MVKESIKVQRFYDELIYGDKATLSKSEEMLKAFPYPTLEQLPSLNVLEVGLGRGEWALSLATYARRYTGLDYSEKTIEYVRKELESNNVQNEIVLKHGTVLSLPFEDRTYDAAYCIGVLHATPDAMQGFRELLRVLKPGGTLNIMLYGQVQPRNIIRDTLFCFSRIGHWAEELILNCVLKLEKYNFSDAWFFNADKNVVLYKDWYFAPIQSHHTIRQIYNWAKSEGADVNYVFLDQYRNTLKIHKRLASDRILGGLFCPDFMASIKKSSALV